MRAPGRPIAGRGSQLAGGRIADVARIAAWSMAGVLAMLAGPVAAQPLRVMQPDRPNETDAPTTVDRGHWQMETGFAGIDRDRADGVVTRTTTYGETDLRLGVTDALEVNVVVQPHIVERVRDEATGARRRAGFGDVTMGGKLNLWGNDADADRTGASAMATKVQLTLPTARYGLGAGGVEATLSLPFAITLPAGFVLNAQPLLARQHDDEGRAVTVYEGAIAISHDVGPLNAYAEYVRADEAGHAAPSAQTVDVGASAAVGRNLVLDAGVRLGVTHAADDLQLTWGASVRF